jgi:hypothetical protein
MKKTDPADEDAGRVIKRRISWEAFYRLRPDLRPANDNSAAATATQSTDPNRRRQWP